jgi:hypothetical protein
MDTETAKAFLKTVHPLPLDDDDEVEQDTFDTLNEVLNFLEKPVFSLYEKQEQLDLETGHLLFGTLNESGCCGSAHRICSLITYGLNADEIFKVTEQYLNEDVGFRTYYATMIILGFVADKEVIESGSGRIFFQQLRHLAKFGNESRFFAAAALVYIVVPSDLDWIREDLNIARENADEDVIEKYESMLKRIEGEL